MLVTQALQHWSPRPTADADPGIRGSHADEDFGAGMPRTKPSDAETRPSGAGAAQLLGEPGEVVAERDLVARLLVGEADLTVAELGHAVRLVAVARRCRPTRRCRCRARSAGWRAPSTRP